MSNINTFFVIVMYLDREGANQTAPAIVLAPNPERAIQSAIEAVADLPDCFEVIGGIMEELNDADAPVPNEHLAAVPANHTVH